MERLNACVRECAAAPPGTCRAPFPRLQKSGDGGTEDFRALFPPSPKLSRFQISGPEPRFFLHNLGQRFESEYGLVLGIFTT